MQIICIGPHCYIHNYFPFSILFATLLALIYIYLTIQVIVLRRRAKSAPELLDKEIFRRKSSALTNFTSALPIVLVLFILAENNNLNNGLLFFFAGFYLLVQIINIYSIYSYEVKTGNYRLRAFGVVGTFSVIIALAAINLYTTFSIFRLF